MDDFQKMTKNNGLKNIEWGSEEFVKKAQTAESLKEEEEAMAEYYQFVTSIQGV